MGRASFQRQQVAPPWLALVEDLSKTGGVGARPAGVLQRAGSLCVSTHILSCAANDSSQRSLHAMCTPKHVYWGERFVGLCAHMYKQ